MQEVIKMMHILVETEDTSSISSPLKTTNRIKFLSLTVSESYIVFGASSGGLYVYDRESFVFKALVPSKEGPVTFVKISPDEKWFGFSTSRGVCCVLEHSGSAVNRRILSHVHEGRNVTALQWNNCSSQLYVGDNSGQISVISVSSYLTPAVALMQLDSAVVQLDTCSYMLLASTMTRSFLCDTFREQYRQIGNRLREGEFGGCFYHVDANEPLINPVQDNSHDQEGAPGPFSSLSDGEWLLADHNLQNIKLFCARPGLRLWEVRIDGAVMNTYQFKQLRHIPPVNIIRPPAVGVSPETNDPHQGNTLQFRKLCNLSNKYLLTYDANGLCVLDPMTSEVILWTDQFKNVIDVHVVDDMMYLWMGDCKLHAVSFTPIDKFLVRMYLQRRYLYCAQLCAAHVSTLKKLAHISLKLHILVDLIEKIKEDEMGNSLDEENAAKINELLDEISKNAQNQDQAQMLKSGIFIVGNAHLLSQKEELRTHRPHNNILEKYQVNDVVDILPNLLRRQDNLPQENGQSEEDTLNGIFKKSILPSISSLSVLSERSNTNIDEDYDPFPDMPLSSLTSTETIMALKSLTTTVSGTITNGTKSLREKWSSIEEKLRGQEEGGLSIEKSINRPSVQVSNLFENCDEEERNNITKTRKKTVRLPTSSFIDTCNQIELYKNNEGKSLEELQYELLYSFVVLYEEFRHSSKGETEKSMDGSSVDKESVCSLRKWLNSSNIVPFPFHEHFEKKFVTTLSHHFQVCLGSGSLTKWISQFLSHFELNYCLFPSHIGRIHTKKSLLLDQAMGRFLEMCSGLLDPHSALHSLDDSGSTCNYFSWNVIVDHFHKSSGMSFASALDGESTSAHSWSIPRTLNAMLVLLQLGQVESCRNIGKHIPIRYILRTMLKLKENPEQISKRFLSYLEKVQEGELLDILGDSEVYYFTRNAFESLHKPEPEEQCSCGYPLKEVGFGPFFHVGLALLTHIYHTSGLEEALVLCQRTGALWHHLLMLRHKQSAEEVLPLILHVACKEELKKRCSELSASSWDLIFQLRSKLEQGFCLHCNARLTGAPNSIPWMSLAYLMLYETNVEFALALLSKYSDSIPTGRINLQFYQSCLLASIAEGQKTEVKKNLLESLTNSHAVPVMSPKVADRLGLPHSEGQHHWGLGLQLSKNQCCCCLLPLASSSGGSVVSFQCRHSFHSICLQQQLLKQCPICAKF